MTHTAARRAIDQANEVSDLATADLFTWVLRDRGKRRADVAVSNCV